MKSKFVLFAILCLAAATLSAQKKKAGAAMSPYIDLKPENFLFKEGSVEFLEYKSQKAMKLAANSGQVVIKGVNFQDGTVEFDVESILPGFAQSIYFHRKDEKEQEIVYFRVTKIGMKLANEAIQYTPYFDGINMWDMYPQYQAPAPIKKGDWNHLKLVISGKRMNVYVNGLPDPVLEIPELEGRETDGTLAFDGASYIANIQVRPGDTGGLSPLPAPDLSKNESNYIRQWATTKPTELPSGNEVTQASMPASSLFTETIDAERMGLVSLTRKFGANPKRKVVWLRAVIEAELDETINLGLGFSDEIWVFLNKQMVYVDKNLYQQGMAKYPKGRISYQNGTVPLVLKKGKNEITVAVANDFYGWGLIARLENVDGLSSLDRFVPPPVVSIENITRYTGTYSKPDAPIKLTFFEKDKELFAQASGQDAFRAEYRGHDLFEIESLNVSLQFRPAEKSVVVKQNGTEQVFTRE